MRIKMNKADFGCVDGFRIIRLEKGAVYELPRRLAAKLINKGSASIVPAKKGGYESQIL